MLSNIIACKWIVNEKKMRNKTIKVVTKVNNSFHYIPIDKTIIVHGYLKETRKL